MLSEDEKERVRYHLGYMATTFGGQQAAAGIQFGVPRPAQTVFLLEEAITILLTNPAAIARVQRLLNILDGMEKKMEAAACTLVAERVGELKLRDDHPDLLEREYVRWAKRLADVLGVPLYPYSDRFRARGAGGSVPVRN